MKGNAMMQSLIMIVAMLLLLAIFVSIIFGSKAKQIAIDFEEINLMKTVNTFSLMDKSLEATWDISSVQAVFRAGEEGLGCDAGGKPGYWFSMDRNKLRTPSLPAAGRKENYRDSNGNLLNANPQVCLPQDINTARYMKEVFEDYTNIPGSGGNDDAWCSALAIAERKSNPELYKCVNTVNTGPYGSCKPDTKIGWCVPGVVKCCMPEIDKPACSTDAVCKYYAAATCKAQLSEAEEELIAADEKTLKALGVESIDSVIYKPEGNDDCKARGHGYCFCINPDERADDRSGADTSINVNGINAKLTPFSRFMWPSYEDVRNDVVTQVRAESGSTKMNSLMFHEYSTSTRFKDLVKAGWAVVGEAMNLNNDFYTNSINFEGTSQSASVVKSRLAAASINLGGGSSALSNSVVGVPATVTAEKISEYLNQKAPALAPYANYFYDMGVDVKYNIDPAFAVAVAIQESAGGTSSDAKNKNNFFGIGPHKTYPTPAAGIEAFYKLIKDFYVPKGQDTIEKMTAPGAYAGNKCKGPPASKYPCCKDFGGHCYCCHTVAEGQGWLTNVAKIRSEINEGASPTIISSSGSITTEIKPSFEFEISKGNHYLAAAQGIWMHYDAEVNIIEVPAGARIGACRQIPEAFKDIFKKSRLEKVWDALGGNHIDDYIGDPVYFFAAMAQFTDWKEDYNENKRYGLLAVPENKLEYCKDVLEKDGIEGLSESEKDSLLKKDVNLDCAIKIMKNLMDELDSYGLWVSGADKKNRAKLALAAYWSDLKTVGVSGSKWNDAKLPEDAVNYATSVWRYYQEYKEGCVSGDFIWPLPFEYNHISHCYGEKRSYALHSGIDIGAPTGTPVYAIADGIVAYICKGDCHGYGNTVTIQHGNIFVRYNHFNSFSITVGTAVKQGDVIGEVGNTGYSFSSHLDIKVYSYKPQEFEYDADIDPVCIFSEAYLKNQVRIVYGNNDECRAASERKSCKDVVVGMEIKNIIGLESGHAGASGGASGEQAVNLDVSKRIKSKLEANGVSVVFDESDSYTKSKDAVFDDAKQKKASLFISIHLNDASNQVAGTVFYQPDDELSRKLASSVQPKLNKVTEFSRTISPAGQGIGSRVYGEHAGMPFVLIEMTYAGDKRTKDESFKEALADAITKGVIEYINANPMERQAYQFTGFQLKEKEDGFEKAPIILKFHVEDWLPVVDCKKTPGKSFIFDGTAYQCENGVMKSMGNVDI